jgi:hypothetical protein
VLIEEDPLQDTKKKKSLKIILENSLFTELVSLTDEFHLSSLPLQDTQEKKKNSLKTILENSLFIELQQTSFIETHLLKRQVPRK